MQKKRWLGLVLFLILGLALTALTYVKTTGYKNDVAVITDYKIKDKLLKKETDIYGNKDEERRQYLHVKVLSGKYKGKTYTVTNTYIPSQLVSQKYRARQRVFIQIHKGVLALISPKRDWVLVLTLTLTFGLLLAIVGRRSWLLVFSLAVSWILFYILILWDVQVNGSGIVWMFSLADIVLSFFSLAIVQGINPKMLVTWLATLLGLFVSFWLCYAVIKLTGESYLNYEMGDYATQDVRGIFMAQTLLGVLGAVMDEATDIVSSLYELIQHKPHITVKELVQSGRTMGQEIMGPLINVLVLLFISEALPETILYFRDNNTIGTTFNFTMSLGATQSAVSAIGIVLTVVFATGCSLIFIKDKSSLKSELKAAIKGLEWGHKE